MNRQNRVVELSLCVTYLKYIWIMINILLTHKHTQIQKYMGAIFIDLTVATGEQMKKQKFLQKIQLHR